jgi:hypothetical protein
MEEVMFFNALNTIGDLVTSVCIWQRPLTSARKATIRAKLEDMISTLDTIDSENYRTQTDNLKSELISDYYDNQFHLFLFARPWLLLTYKEKMLVDSIHQHFIKVLSTEYQNLYEFVDNTLAEFDNLYNISMDHPST